MDNQQPRILVVDDEEVNRDILVRRLIRRGYQVEAVADGQQALDWLAGQPCDLVLLDVMMPVLDGLSALRRLRRDFSPTALPVIMTTARDDSEDVVTALEAGASDYVTKPIDFPVLQARMDTQLRLKRTTEELTAAYQRIKTEIEAAALVQRAQIPAGPLTFEGWRCACRYQPCAELGGDILNYFPLDDELLALYLLDVSGHGAGAALLSSGVGRLLSASGDRITLTGASQDIFADQQAQPPRRRNSDRPASPGEILARLNRRFPIESTTSQFFTIIYVIIDCRQGLVRYASAGHPGPLVMEPSGQVRYASGTGLPVGIMENAEFVEHELPLAAGGRMLFFSDGIIEALDHRQQQFGVQRLTAVLEEGRDQELEDVLDMIIGAVREWSDGPPQDDISLLGVERK